ncbi:MAG: peptidylprolyl isomerase [Dysgonamonadaceae bacterium]|nr:peptidylprolyl isomerase [Dysgonamonadaceae bacterium]
MATSCQSNAQTYTIETSLGNIQVKLYDNTSLHKANFEKSVAEQVYDSILFHRIIEGFMIQTGDPATKPGANRATTTEGETIPAEFVPENFHKKGALAAARMGDPVNPEKRSSPTQFYIVQGRPFSEEELNFMESYHGKSWTPEQKEIYKTLGGAPFLDQDYTVFGEVVDGLDIVDKIAALPTDSRDFPLSDIRIIKITKD